MKLFNLEWKQVNIYPGIPMAPRPRDGDRLPMSGKWVKEPIIPVATLLGLTTVWVLLIKNSYD